MTAHKPRHVSPAARLWPVRVLLLGSLALLASACSGGASSAPGGDPDGGPDGGPIDGRGGPDLWHGPDLFPGGDVTADGFDKPDQVADVVLVEGGFLWPCDDMDDCQVGFCVATAEERVCSRSCLESCPSGWVCGNVANPPDVQYICLPRHPALCHPCTTSDDCRGDHSGEGSLCVVYDPAVGQFCGGACEDDADCPAGYTCAERAVAEGGRALQCVLADGAECTCNAMSLGKRTPCWQENAAGRCVGERTCTMAGLIVCGAALPQVETCDGQDNDCDGETDDDCDGDGVPVPPDNCPVHNNPEQTDTDGDNVGDACDGDDDADGTPDTTDCAPLDRFVYPGASEGCDGVDNDCDGFTDEGLCDDSNPCTNDFCDASGACQHAPNTSSCDDLSVCTLLDHCEGGQCVGAYQLDCNDGDPCTEDTCDGHFGCAHVPFSGFCDDSNPCTISEQCIDGVCGNGVRNPCDDGDICTADNCVDGVGCQHLPTNPCNDFNPCTDDHCLPGGQGCTWSYNSESCDDGDPCTTIDRCSSGLCTGYAPLNCDDGNPCTDDSCPSLVGCRHVNNSNPCNDGDTCSEGDQCVNGTCQPGSVSPCADGNPCTLDSCLPDGGCSNTPYNPCDDGNVCTQDTCDPVQGCRFVPLNTGSCDDGDICTLGDHCQAGACVGAVEACEDGDPCTDNFCTPGVGCRQSYNSGPCDDGNPCTSGDYCSVGNCRAGSGTPNCNDGNPCTRDYCSPAAFGCTHEPLNGNCDDDDPCTVGEQCLGGSCGGGQPYCEGYCEWECDGWVSLATCLPLGSMPVCTCLCF